MYIEEDEEKAYVLYMKYIYLLTEIRKFPDFQKEKDFINKLLGSNSKQEKVIDKVEILSDSLKKRYDIMALSLQNGLDDRNSIETNQQPHHHHHNQESQQINNVLDGNKSISCKDLYSLITTVGCRFLIMDTRPRVEFTTSQVFCDRCVNVPEDLLYAGNTAGKIEASLPFESKELWQSRKDQERIILMDWNSSNHLARNSPIWHLKEILENVS